MSNSRVFDKVAMSLMETRLLRLSFDHREVVEPGTQHRQNIGVNQGLSIVKGPNGGLLGIGRAKIVVESLLFEPERPHFRIECEYGGVFKVVDAEPGLHADAKVSDGVVDAVCGCLLPLVTSEIGRTLWESGLKLQPKIWSMEASRELVASASLGGTGLPKKKRPARPRPKK